MRRLLILCVWTLAPALWAAPVDYLIDPSHTYPSFEADHMGLSVWRGKFNQTAGKITLDKAAQQGSVQVIINVDSIDFGHDLMNAKAKGSDLFDVQKYPQAMYNGKFEGFVSGVPTRVVGDLTLHGVTRPVVLTINTLKCAPHLMLRREVCGADALALFKRDDFGIDAGKAFGFNMDVTLRIQVEAIAAE